MGFQVDFLTSLAQYLHNENCGTYSETGTFPPDVTAITIDQLPLEPDNAFCLTLYPVTDSGGTDSVIGVQARIRGNRGDRRAVKDTADRIFDTLHDLQRVVFGGSHVVRVWRNSGANLTPDDNNRQQSTANYYFQITRPGTHRTD